MRSVKNKKVTFCFCYNCYYEYLVSPFQSSILTSVILNYNFKTWGTNIYRHLLHFCNKLSEREIKEKNSILMVSKRIKYLEIMETVRH